MIWKLGRRSFVSSLAAAGAGLLSPRTLHAAAKTIKAGPQVRWRPHHRYQEWARLYRQCLCRARFDSDHQHRRYHHGHRWIPDEAGGDGTNAHGQ